MASRLRMFTLVSPRLPSRHSNPGSHQQQKKECGDKSGLNSLPNVKPWLVAQSFQGLNQIGHISGEVCVTDFDRLVPD